MAGRLPGRDAEAIAEAAARTVAEAEMARPNPAALHRVRGRSTYASIAGADPSNPSLNPVRVARQRAGMSLQELAALVRIDPAHLGLIEQGSHLAAPSIAELEDTAAAIGVPLGELLSQDGKGTCRRGSGEDCAAGSTRRRSCEPRDAGAAGERRRRRCVVDRLLFRIVPAGQGWAVEHAGDRSMAYSTREAALEAVLGPVSNAIKEGAAITVEIAAPPPGEPVIEPRGIQ
jgi:transcriptional regulator with XRE-family HTH domain